ncbi:alpha/beta hydrolase [Saxibacter everestensis]|uniref:Alpha/beta hydrolase n=1 Tax=Saxibacter everestensis TaxID=2909229 RepID=A0ABY8QRX0_9MICO|nr:alpha/beta hydrolase [Brevibacteriaceae bacterium ZFBP1038]
MSETSNDWQPDILGTGFEQLALPLDDDSQGSVVATLIRYRPSSQSATAPNAAANGTTRLASQDQPNAPAAKTNVLYVHGWSDYFFQTELAQFWHHAGANFYALDLRKYGRSLGPHQTPGYITSLTTYDEDIEAALKVIQTENPESRLILNGHSTGGLTLSLWANRHPGVADGLVLNSPWLEFQWKSRARMAISPFVNLSAKTRPGSPIPIVMPDFYARTVSFANEGLLEYNVDWRPSRGFAIYPAWLNAIFTAHSQVAEGLRIDCPALVLLSSKSLLHARWSEDMNESDVALDVDVVAHRALSLGETVTVSRVPGAVHDIVLSPKSVRERGFAEITRWLGGYLPEPDAPAVVHQNHRPPRWQRVLHALRD